MALRTVTVKSSGGSYTSLSGAEAGEQGDLVSLDRQLVIECYAMFDSAVASFAGWVTDATRYIHVTVPLAERHRGTWDNSKYRLMAASWGGAINVNNCRVHITGVQVRNTLADQDISWQGGSGIISEVGAGNVSGELHIDSCILQSAATSATQDSYGVRLAPVGSIRNSVVYDFYEGINSNGGANDKEFVIYGNTVARCYAGISLNIYATGTVARVKNNLVQATAVGFQYASGVPTQDYATNLSKQNDAPGTGSVQSTTLDFMDPKREVFALHPTSDSEAVGAGTDLSGTFTTDIRGTTRDSTWDIGAFAHTAVAAVKTVKPSGGDYTSLSAAEAGLQADLVAGNYVQPIECHAMQDNPVAFDGWNCTASQYIRVYAAQSHGGKWSTSVHRMVGAVWTVNGAAFYTIVPWMHLEGLQAQDTQTDQDYPSHGFLIQQGGAVLQNCIARYAGTKSGGPAYGFTVGTPPAPTILYNCLGYCTLSTSNFTGIGLNSGAYGHAVIYNSAFRGSYRAMDVGMWNFGQWLILRNVLLEMIGAGLAYYVSATPGGGTTWERVATNDATSPDTSYRNRTFTFVDAANEDFRLASTDTGAKDVGVDLSAAVWRGFTTDIAGTTRPQGSAWDIGAFEYVGASTFKFYAATLVAGASYSREDGGTFYADILAGLATGGDGLYVRSPLPPTGTPFKVGNITLDTSRIGVALNYEYGKEGAATINQTIQLRSADGTTLIREAVHNNVAARPLVGTMDLSDLTLSGSYSVWAIDVQV